MECVIVSLVPRYRVGNSNRVIGDIASPPEGFVVINLSTKECFVVSGGAWNAYTEAISDIIVEVWSLPWTVPATIFTFYIDPLGGDDSNTGTSPASPWRTTAKSDTYVLTEFQSIGYLFN